MKDIKNNLKVSLIVVTYNQEKVVEDAVQSALLQDYSPLEIILSDDCSTDGTFGIMLEMASRYKGPHVVRVNKNPENLGIGKHWDTISRQATGDLIVHAAGDDISIPSRVNVLVDAWIAHDPRPTMISSDGIIMTYDGTPVRHHIGGRWSGKTQIQRKPRSYDLDLLDVPVCGFSLAIDRNLYDSLEPIQDRLWAEDVMLRRRALLLQGIMYIPDALVFYRDQGLSKGAKKNQHAYMELFNAHALTQISMVRQSIRDVAALSPSDADSYLVTLHRQERSANRRLKLVKGGFFTSAIMLFCQLVTKLDFGIQRKEYISIFIIRWAPQIFFGLKNTKLAVRNYFQN